MQKISNQQSAIISGKLECPIFFYLLFVTLNFFPQMLFADPIFRINNGTNQAINKFTICKKITNASGKDIMVPTNTSGEWSAFLAHLPAGVTAGVCGPCDGVTMGSAAPGGAICAGVFNGSNYMVTPGGCTNSGTPTCAGGTDTVQKSWNDGSNPGYTPPGLENVLLDTSPSTQTGDTEQALIIAYATGTPPPAGAGRHYYAAEFCHSMSYGGYTDWYLPSKSELAYLFCNSNKSSSKSVSYPQEKTDCAGAYNGPTTLLTGFASARYYSSSVADNSGYYAWAEDFSTGAQDINWHDDGTYLYTSFYIRCIRKY